MWLVRGFVAHPNCQQLLSGIWYEGLPGFRNRNIIYKVSCIRLIQIPRESSAILPIAVGEIC
ncbi:hypothetical protein ANCDUO_26909 [Ancylostoma duodenale]|uniref:Uncharacterized protein n=1 Tax=Ancylostoma duodenale TaxID=51022 RepID=A0A0C2BH41_9BILA|nr:hypothetical protein ANCDUO_26909 [Ancylostoma duodenale]